MDSIIEYFSRYDPFFWLIVTLGFSAIVMSAHSSLWRMLSKPISVSYRVALVGLPRSGKTALISAVFARIFTRPKFSKLNLAGTENIRQLNRNIAALRGGEPLPPTKEDDATIFRFIMSKRGLSPFSFRYEGEVVDFPGELSEEMLKSSENEKLREDFGLFHQKFHSWIVSSRVLIFVIDIGATAFAKSPKKYAEKLSGEIRSTWQILTQEDEDQFTSRRKKVAIVFAKSDVAVSVDLISSSFDEQRLYELIFEGGRLPTSATDEEIQNAIAEVRAYSQIHYGPLISFFDNQDVETQTFYTSVYEHKDFDAELDGLIDFTFP